MKNLKIRVFPNAKKTEVVEGEPLKVYVNAPPSENRANIAVLLAIADHFNVSKGKVRLVKGLKSRDKIVEIRD